MKINKVNCHFLYSLILLILLILLHYFQYLSFNTTSLSSILSNYPNLYNQYSIQNISRIYIDIYDSPILNNEQDCNKNSSYNKKVSLFKGLPFQRFLSNVFEKIITIQNNLKRLIRFKKKNNMKKIDTNNNMTWNKSFQYKQEENNNNNNNHIESDISFIGLTRKQIELACNAYEIIINHTNYSIFLNHSMETDFILSPHLAFRYYESVDWANKYNDRKIDEAIIDTIIWRKTFGIHMIDLKSIKHMIYNGFAYTSQVPDKFNRSILYVKVAGNIQKETSDNYLNLLMYSVERADRQSVQFKSGEFVALIDLKGFSWTTSPSISVMQHSLTLLKRHYPYRFAAVYILNTNGAFQFIWNLLKPLLPKKALLKTFVVSQSVALRFLTEKIGLSSLEISYGGTQKELFGMNSNSTIEDVHHYIRQGYWKPISPL